MAHATGNIIAHPKVIINPDLSHLDRSEMLVLGYLADAIRVTNDIYLVQSRQNIKNDQDVFDKTLGHSFFPPETTIEEVEDYLKKNPEKRSAVMSPFTVVVRVKGRLQSIPYSEFYQPQYDEIVDNLEKASVEARSGPFRDFLLARAKAFETNEYRKSDIDWIHLSDSIFEFTIGPYESYDDSLFGVKRSLQGMLGVVLPQETEETNELQDQIQSFDKQLSKLYGYSSNTTLTPMVVMDQVIAGGANWYGSATMAFNLPNEADIHKEVGSKKVFIRNVTSEKFDRITKEISKRVVARKHRRAVSGDPFFYFLIGHESSHGLSFRFGNSPFRELGSALEEAKADIFGELFLYYLADKGIVTREFVEKAIISNMTDALRQIRSNTKSAHGLSALMQYNWFIEKEALWIDECIIDFNPGLFEQTLKHCADGLYSLSQVKNYSAANMFVQKWNYMPDELRDVIGRLALEEIPIDIDLTFVV